MGEIRELSGKGVLIADSDDLVRQIMRSGFEARNSVVYDAATITEALGHLQVGEVHLIISETRFPSGNGSLANWKMTPVPILPNPHFRMNTSRAI